MPPEPSAPKPKTYNFLAYTVTWIPTNSGSIGDLGNVTALSCQVTDGQGTHLDFGVDGVTFTVKRGDILGFLGRGR